MTQALTPHQITQTVLRILGEIAPEADLTVLKADVSFRDQLDIDSVDFLNFVIGLHDALAVEIPESDYPRLLTLNGCIDYLSRCSASG